MADATPAPAPEVDRTAPSHTLQLIINDLVRDHSDAVEAVEYHENHAQGAQARADELLRTLQRSRVALDLLKEAGL